MVDGDELTAAEREVIDTANAWARERHEMRAAIGAVVDSIVGETEDGRSVAVLQPELVDNLRQVTQ